MRPLADSFFGVARRDAREVALINKLRTEYERADDKTLNEVGSNATDLPRLFAATAAIAERVLRQRMFDVQLRGALALARGSIAEMQTGEGKTLAAVPAIAWLARTQGGVHVMTVNDYLARRDSQWMGEIYRRIGLRVACLQPGMTALERRAVYQANVVYATANEIGFDFLRDQIALHARDQVQRAFHALVIDEADSILIDEARIPLVIAGAGESHAAGAYAADTLARRLHAGAHYSIDPGAHNIVLTDSGIELAEHFFGFVNLFDERNLAVHTALQDALHAHLLLRRDVDYIVKNGAVEMVDEFRGRVAMDRRWPAGLHTAIEIKEGVATKEQGRILGSITMQHLVALYSHVCGMTGTAKSSSAELEAMHLLPVEVIPTNRPLIRVDHPDRIFPSRAEKHEALIEEIRSANRRGQPVLIGTANIGESEILSRELSGIPHSVLNAKNDALEAEIIAKAGQRGAVTISTNMAGRGTDIKLGEGVTELGGLYVIGTTKHESRRIDNQLRGRAGRQGDPGASRFFISLEDDLLVKYQDLRARYKNDSDSLQRLVEGHNLDTRLFLNKYELPIEGQRHKIQTFRQSVLLGERSAQSDLERVGALRAIDDAWSDYLAELTEYRSGLLWISLAGRDPHREYIAFIHQAFAHLESALPTEIDGGGMPRKRVPAPIPLSGARCGPMSRQTCPLAPCLSAGSKGCSENSARAFELTPYSAPLS